MSYLGNSPGVGSFITATERFNGTGSCTQFTITQTGIQDANTIDVIVSNVPQDPTNSYSITNGVITFTEAPPSGTNNIVVRYRATTVITYNSITTSQILDGQITASKLASGVLPSDKANSAAVYANSAFLQANTPIYTANSAATYANGAFTQANSAYVLANTPSYTANSGASYANSAFLTANTPSNVANSAASYANSGFAVANSAASYANSAFSKANTVNLTTQVTGTLPVGNGGTGAATLTSNNVLLGNGTSAVQFVAPGTSGNVLTSNGTTWTSAAASGGVTSLNGQTGAVTTTTLGNIGNVMGAASNSTSNILMNTTASGSTLYYATGGSATYMNANLTYWFLEGNTGTNPNSSAVCTWNGDITRQNPGNTGFVAQSTNVTTLSGTWRLLSGFVRARFSGYDGACGSNNTTSVMYGALWVRVS